MSSNACNPDNLESVNSLQWDCVFLVFSGLRYVPLRTPCGASIPYAGLYITVTDVLKQLTLRAKSHSATAELSVTSGNEAFPRTMGGIMAPHQESEEERRASEPAIFHLTRDSPEDDRHGIFSYC